MRIDKIHSFNFDALLEREAMAQVIEGLAPVFDITTARDRSGLIVASNNAGSATSLHFWAQAVEVGVAVASPELFPWCLANAPCGALSRHFGITGPNATLLGEGDALVGAVDTAAQWLVSRRVDHAIVVALSFAGSAAPGRALALCLAGSDGKPAGHFEALRAQLAPLTLCAAIEALREPMSIERASPAREPLSAK